MYYCEVPIVAVFKHKYNRNHDYFQWNKYLFICIVSPLNLEDQEDHEHHLAPDIYKWLYSIFFQQLCPVKMHLQVRLFWKQIYKYIIKTGNV